MSVWRTMTVGGMYGPEYEADTADEAEAMAVAGGDDVLDIMDDLLVVAD